MNFQKDLNDQSGLRLVPDLDEPKHKVPIEQQFVSFMFFRISAEWRRLSAEEKSEHKREFLAIIGEYESDCLVFSYSLVGFDSKADLMFWRIGRSLDLLQEMTAKLYNSRLGGYLEPSDLYLSVTKKRAFVSDGGEDKQHVVAGDKSYLFLYPCARNRDAKEISNEEREALIEEAFMVGRKFQNIKIHLTHAFGFTDQEYIILFETNEPRDFLALAEELREAPSSKVALRGMPIYTCRQRPIGECLDSLG